MTDHLIFGVHITDRLTRASEVQALLTEYGTCIKTRLGLHELEAAPAPRGLLLLEMFGDKSRCEELKTKLGAIPGVEVQEMHFSHS